MNREKVLYKAIDESIGAFHVQSVDLNYSDGFEARHTWENIDLVKVS